MGLGAKRTRTSPAVNSLSALQQTHCLSRDALAAAREAETFGGRAAHAHPRGLDAQGAREVPLHLVAVVSYLRALAYDHGVHVRHLPGLADYRPDLTQKLHRVGVLEPLVGVGEVVADVFEAGGAQEGVGDGVGEDVGVGVAEEPLLEGYLDTAEDDLALYACSILDKGVYIDAEANAEAQLRTP